MDLDTIREGLLSALEPIHELTAYKYVPLSVTAPCFFLSKGEDVPIAPLYEAAQIGVTVLVPVTPQGQEKLDEFVSAEGDLSIRQAVEADGTLGGRVGSTAYKGAGAYELIEIGQPYIGCVLRFEVIA